MLALVQRWQKGWHDDILLGGRTTYSFDRETLCEFLDIGTRADLIVAQQVYRLSSGAFALSQTTVIDDGEYDLITGAAGEDWWTASRQTAAIPQFLSTSD